MKETDEFFIRNGRVALSGKNELLHRDIRVKGGKIVEIGRDLPDRGDPSASIDAEGLDVFPGGIDPHVHFDDPGYTHREDFAHGTAMAASGGVTTIIDMPCTSVPPVTDLRNLKEKLAVVSQKAVVDFAFFGGISGQVYAAGREAPMRELAPYVRGFKVYATSGMASFHRLGPYELEQTLVTAAALGRPVLLHAEDHEFIASAVIEETLRGKGPENYYKARPEEAELLSIQAAVLLASQAKSDLHIVHLGTSGGASIIHKAGFSCETCPQYLEFDLEDFKRLGSVLKCSPPVKPGQRDLLWAGLKDGSISFVASDHAPSPAEEKNTGSIWTDYGGLPGTGTLWPYMYSEGFRKGRLRLARFLEVVSGSAARRYGLSNRKGSIETGKDADLILLDPAGTFTVRGEEFLSKGKLTPFEGRVFSGRIRKTLVRGRIVWDADQGISVEPGFGRFLSRAEL